MKIEINASTKIGYVLPKEEALDFSGKAAGICYLPHDTETLFNEPKEKTMKRANSTIASGHHSVFSHITYNLLLTDVPKIIAMIINNEKIYNTSEKSGRYTVMKTEGKEAEYYNKWVKIFEEKIREAYPTFTDKQVNKLALENARYLISVFTPATTMEYTVSFGQLNYIINWMKDYINNAPSNNFNDKLKVALKEFLDAMPDLEVEGLNSSLKNRKLSLFAERKRKESFDEMFCTNYKMSFAGLGQEMRHRTLSFEAYIPGMFDNANNTVNNNGGYGKNNMATNGFSDKIEFYIPPIIKNTPYEKEWLDNITELSDNYPQGMLIEVNERGTVENFILKCTERLCGAAQIEIMEQTKETLKRYLEETKENNETIYNYLLPYSKGARCTFPNWKCNAPCVFKASKALDRKV